MSPGVKLRPSCVPLDALYDLFDAGKFEEVVDLTRGSANGGEVVVDSLSLVATGLISEKNGDMDLAESCFQKVFANGVPLPALLRECGRYFKRRENYEQAYHCFSLLQAVTPGAIAEFVAGLPEQQLCRYAPWSIPRLLYGKRPGFYALQPKASLVKQLGVIGAAQSFAQLSGWKQRRQIEDLPLVGLHDFAKASAIAYEELIPSRTIYLPPPPVFRDPQLELRRGSHVSTRTFFSCVLADAVVSSKSNFVVAGGRAVLDFQNDELQKLPLDLDVDPIVVTAASDTVTVSAAVSDRSLPEYEQAFSLLGVHSYAFGHWMLEFLPKIWASVDSPGFGSVPLLIDEQMPAQHREALELFVGPDHPIVVIEPGKSVRVKKLWDCSQILYLPLGPKPGLPIPQTTIDTMAFAEQIGAVSRRLPDFASSGEAKRLYLKRHPSQHRRLINASEVEAWAVDHGFAIVDFAEISFTEQLSLVRGADIIIGPDGSAFLASLFARPGTRIGMFSHEFPEDFDWICQMKRQLGCVLTS